jgi:hypothetical protein
MINGMPVTEATGRRVLWECSICGYRLWTEELWEFRLI